MSAATKRTPVVGQEQDDDAPPMLSLTSKPERPVEYRDAFEINGTMWRIRTAAPPNVRMRYVHLLRTRGTGIAQDYLIEALLEPGAYAALLEFGSLTQEHVDAVVEIAAAVMLGEV